MICSLPGSLEQRHGSVGRMEGCPPVPAIWVPLGLEEASGRNSAAWISFPGILQAKRLIDVPDQTSQREKPVPVWELLEAEIAVFIALWGRARGAERFCSVTSTHVHAMVPPISGQIQR